MARPLKKQQAYTPPDSLWQFIKSIAEPPELDTIKERIGSSLLETNGDLHNEVDSLLEIWRDFRTETVSSPSGRRSGGALPEAPNIRQTLKKEISFFVAQMREQCRTEDTFCRQIVNNKHNLHVINYVLNSTATPSRSKSYSLGSASESGGGRSVFERPPSSLNAYGQETPLVSCREGEGGHGVGGAAPGQRVSYTSMSGAKSSSRLSSYGDKLSDNKVINPYYKIVAHGQHS